MQSLYQRKKDLDQIAHNYLSESCKTLLKLMDILNTCKPLPSAPAGTTLSGEILTRMFVLLAMNENLSDEYSKFQRSFSENPSVETFDKMEEEFKESHNQFMLQTIEFSKVVLKAVGRSEGELNEPITDFGKLWDLITKAIENEKA